MEENENKTLEEEVTQPSREEILAMSREENKSGDEMKKDIYKTGARLSFRIGMIIAVIVSALCLIFRTSEELMLPMYSVVFGMIATNYLYVAKKENKKLLFGLAVAMAVSTVVLFVTWVLILCGVNI